MRLEKSRITLLAVLLFFVFAGKTSFAQELTDDASAYSLSPLSAPEVEVVAKMKAKINVSTLQPNPAKEVSKLKLELTERATVDVSITDPTGKKLSNLFKRELAPGTHNFNLKLLSMPAGIYLVKINSKMGSITKELVVVD